MKIFTHAIISLAVCMLVSATVKSQSNLDCDQLRLKTADLEQMNTASMSPSVQKVHREALLKLYGSLQACIEKELAIVSEMRTTVADTDAAPAVETKFKSLSQEQLKTTSKLAALRTALGIADPQPAAGVSRDGATAAPAAGDAVLVPPVPQPSATPRRFECIAGAPYANPPLLLTDIVTKAADGVVQGDFGGDLSGLPQMMLYATLDAASPSSSKLLRGLKPYQYLSETARTDKQLGASAKSDGAVSAFEKPGFARLLGFALEHGAINKKNDGTNLTLSTSLYSLYTLKREDTAETYDQAGFLNRVGVSASFAVDNKNADLAAVRRKNLTEWGVKARLFGDRSTRSAGFTRYWNEEVVPLIDARLEAVGQPIFDLTKNDPGYLNFRVQVERCLADAVKARKEEPDYKATSTTDAQRVVMLRDLLLSRLQSNVFQRIRELDFQLSDDLIARIETQYVPNLKVALENLVAVEGEIEKKLEDLAKGPLGTFAYTNHRTSSGSDYSETKFLFEQDKSFFRPLKLTGNLGVSFYNRPDRTINQQKLRDLTAALAFEGTARSPFTEDENQSKVTFAFVGRYERFFENRRTASRKPDIGTFQFVTEIPFLKGFSLPLSLSYSNATEEDRKKNVRFNFGMRLDTDKLFELLLSRPKP